MECDMVLWANRDVIVLHCFKYGRFLLFRADNMRVLMFKMLSAVVG